MEIKTISLKGKKYAQVKDRVGQFHKDHEDGQIKTSYVFVEDKCIFKAKVSFGEPVREFTGHALGKGGTIKAFEKTETVAVGRALGMAGYLSDGEIATYDEITRK